MWYKCFVTDVTKTRLESAQADGFRIEKSPSNISYSFVDICTPSNTHIEVLRRIISDDVRFDRVIIEKPLFNNAYENIYCMSYLIMIIHYMKELLLMNNITDQK